MSSKGFSELEIDAIGEILNISLGASATAISTMLGGRVDITTPVVRVVSRAEFDFKNLEPAVGVEITYVSGLSGSNIMLLKRHDVKAIVEMLMGMDIPDEEFEMNEMNISAICEVMNQMMGASSTALSEFLNRVVNISTPVSFEINDENAFKNKYFQDEDAPMVVIGFSLTILDKLKSEFINVMSPQLAKDLVAGLLPDEYDVKEDIPEVIQPPIHAPEESGSSRKLTQEEIEKMIAASAGESVPVEKPVAEVLMGANTVEPNIVEPNVQINNQQSTILPSNMENTVMDPLAASVVQNQIFMQQMMQQMQQMMQQMQQPVKQQAPPPKTINVHTMPQPNISQEDAAGGEEDENMELIRGVPLEISVEIGRTKKLVKDILEFSKGSLVVLDKVAGEQVDLFVNGQCIAKGDVVVVEDNFGIRITEIVRKDIILE